MAAMASGIVLTVRPAVVRACAVAPGGGGERGQRSPSQRGAGSWWTPIFGWGAEPDYIEGGAAAGNGAERAEERAAGPRRRFAAFTEEKARELRMRTMETESFHDAMYHSAIASRLASDRPRRSSSAP